MSLRTLTILLLLSVPLTMNSATCNADVVEDATSSSFSDQANQLIKKGISLHDQRKYSEAIAAYEEALTHDPGNFTALYEITYSYLVAGDYENAHASARRGMGSRSPFVAELYALSATALDEMGKPQEAIAEFVQALKLFPDNHSLSLNLTVSYLREGDMNNAREVAEKTVLLKPVHPSAHLLLGQIYARQKEKIPALMALGRFLTLEPNSKRTQVATDIVKSLLTPAMTGGAPVLVMDVNGMANDERPGSGYISAARQLELGLALKVVLQKRTKDESFSGSPVFFGMNMLSELFKEDGEYPNNFATRYYLPLYQDLNKQGYNEAFARQSLLILDPAGASSWFSENRQIVEDFNAWSNAFSKPKSK